MFSNKYQKSYDGQVEGTMTFNPKTVKKNIDETSQYT